MKSQTYTSPVPIIPPNQEKPKAAQLHQPRATTSTQGNSVGILQCHIKCDIWKARLNGCEDQSRNKQIITELLHIYKGAIW